MQNPGKLIDEEGHQFHVCWYMYLQTSSQENIVSRPHTLQMSVWYDFHWHHLLETGAWNLV